MKGISHLFPGKRYRVLLSLAAGLLLAAGLVAALSTAEAALPGPTQAPGAIFVINATGPLRNALDVPVTAAVSATFSTAVDVGTVSTATFVVHGGFTGRYAGGFSFSPDLTRLVFDPENDFKAGEWLQVSASRAISSSLGAALTPHGWSFTAAAGSSGAIMSSHPLSFTFGADNSTDIKLGDLDGDGDLDAVVANDLGQAQTAWLNNGDGGFSAHDSFGNQYSNAVALGDLDGDGDLDAVVANDLNLAQTVWLNDGSGDFSANGSFGSGYSTDVALGDLDGDGDLDAVVANYAAPQTVWLNDGSGVFIAHGSFVSGVSYSHAVALGDLDGDGDLDAVVANDQSWAETVWLNNGSAVYSAHPGAPSFGGEESRSVALGDLDGDGDLDAVVANYDSQAETVWLNDGGGGFSAHGLIPSFGAGISIDVALGDLDGDGDLDAVVANGGALDAETVWLNDGSAGFIAHGVIPSFGAGFSYAVALGDLDGDGDLDALVANTFPEAETVWLNGPVFRLYIPMMID